MNELVVNGKHYPLWSQFITGKEKWVGGTLQDLDGMSPVKITDITLKPNGETSAYFAVEGTDYTCGFDVQYGGIVPGEDGWLTFSGYGGHTWRIQEHKPIACDASEKK